MGLSCAYTLCDGFQHHNFPPTGSLLEAICYCPHIYHHVFDCILSCCLHLMASLLVLLYRNSRWQEFSFSIIRPSDKEGVWKFRGWTHHGWICKRHLLTYIKCWNLYTFLVLNLFHIKCSQTIAIKLSLAEHTLCSDLTLHFTENEPVSYF